MKIGYMVGEATGAVPSVVALVERGQRIEAAGWTRLGSPRSSSMRPLRGSALVPHHVGPGRRRRVRGLDGGG